MAGLRVEMARDTNRHVKKTLPPTLTGLPGQGEIRYYVKVTVQRPAFYKENWRQVSSSHLIFATVIRQQAIYTSSTGRGMKKEETCCFTLVVVVRLT